MQGSVEVVLSVVDFEMVGDWEGFVCEVEVVVVVRWFDVVIHFVELLSVDWEMFFENLVVLVVRYV